MHLLAAFSSGSGFPLIISAGVATYIASKAAVDAVVGGGVPTPGRLAIGQSLPIIVLGVVAMSTDRPQIAVGIVFSTAVACLSLAAGTAVFLSPPEGSPASRRCWAMLLPAGLLAFLAGFRAEISAFDAVVLAVQGVFVLRLWNDTTPKSVEPATTEPVEKRRSILLRVPQFLLAVALASVGAWFAMRGVDIAAASTEIGSAGLLTATILSPLLVLPIIGVGSELAQKQQSSVAVSSHVGVALLNVFMLLPLLVLLSYRHELLSSIQGAWGSVPGPVVVPSPHSFPSFSGAVIFPLAVWRVDVVMMIALGLFLLPVAVGRWSLGKAHGLAMMFGYAVYLGLSLAVGVRKV